MTNHTLVDRCEILICEDVRLEPGGKMSLLGLYADSMFFSEAAWNGKNQAAIASLAFVVRLFGAEGDVNVKISFVKPDDSTLLPPAEFEQCNVKKENATSFVAKSGPLVIDQLGEYKIVVEINDTETYTKPFRIGTQPDEEFARRLEKLV